MSDLPAKPMDPMAEFKQKLGERVREDIRDLLPADAVQKLVDEAVRETFFTSRRVDRGYGRYDDKPSWFIEEVAKAAEPLLRESVADYVSKNKDVIDKAMADYLTPENLTLLAVGRMSAGIEVALFNLAQAFNNRQI